MPNPKDFYNRVLFEIGKQEESYYTRVLEIVKNARLSFSEGTVISVEISVYDEKKDVERKRTEQQNKYYHKLLDIICGYTGDTHMDLHTNLKVEFLSKPWVKGDKEYTIVSSTKELTSKNFGKYIDRVFQWAAEQDIVLPSSEDYYS